MPETIRPSGLRITAPANFAIVSSAPAAGPLATGAQRATASPRSRFRPVPLPIPPAVGGEEDALLAALKRQGMHLVDAVELQPRPETTPPDRVRRSSAPPSGTQSAKLELDLPPDERAVVLLEQEGVYSWVFPGERTKAAGRGTSRQRSPVALPGEAPGVRMVFEIEVHAASTVEQRPDRRGFLKELGYSAVKALVLKFAARFVVGQAMTFMEKHVSRGIVIMDSDDPAKWRRVDDVSALSLPGDRPARILLLVHGTFSSTLGSFGALGSTPWGREFLGAARASYDAVIGFDHPTLSVDPLVNAQDLLARLQGINWKYPPRFHAVSYSRGGLVFRSLVEYLLPTAGWPATFERAVFVGSTNGGTQLALPDNWHALADLYTNLATATVRVIGLMPQATAVTEILGEMIDGVGALIKYMATEAVTAGGVPGLAAMESGGEFVARINETQPGQPRPEDVWYFAVTSEFKARVSGEKHEPRELPKRLVLALADGFVDQLMQGAPNDLVVDTASMTALDVGAGAFFRETYDFGATPHVYHLNYFTRPEVTNALARWLQLTAPAAAPAPARPRGGKQPRGGAVAPHRAPLGSLAAASFAYAEIAAAVDTDILVTEVRMPVEETRDEIVTRAPSYVVLQRAYQGETLNYAFRAEDLLDKLSARQSDELLFEALDLHETDRSLTRSSSRGSEAASHQPEVVLRGGDPVGVLPPVAEIPDTDELVKLAQRAFDPVSTEDRILARRFLPTILVDTPGIGDIAGGHTPKAGATPAGGRTARSRGRGGAAGERPPKTESVRGQCHFRSEMDEEVVLKHTVTVEVNISREVIGGALHAAAAEMSAEVDLSRKIVLQVIPKRNFETIGEESRVEIDPPAPGAPQTFYFDLRATHDDDGEGEIWVVARQGQVPLATLVLKPRIAAKRSGGGRRVTSSVTMAEAPPLSEPLTQLFITEKINGSQVSYLFQLQAPDLQLLAWGESRPIRGNREQYVRRIYSEIENRWVSSKKDTEDFYEELRAYGAELLDELVPDKVQAALWEHRDKIDSIMVLAEEPFIPWEIVQVKEPGKALTPGTRFLGEMGLVRWLHEAGWPPESVPLRRGHVRYIIPEYAHPDYVLPQTAEERAFLENTFGATAVEPTSSAVRKILAARGGFDLLHFAGHGEAEAQDTANAAILLQGRVENGQFIRDYFNATTAEYHSAFQQEGTPGPIIVLNACQVGRSSYKLTGTGGFARAFLKRGASTFIGALWSVGDYPARTFTEELYRQMKKGNRLAGAVRAARAKAREAGEATWLAYVAYGHPHARWIGRW